MAALPQDEAGETDRIISQLKTALERVKARLDKAREDNRVNAVLDALQAALTPAEMTVVLGAVPRRDAEDLAGLRAERDALAKAIDTLRARLNG